MATTVGLTFEVNPEATEIEELKAYAEEKGIDIGNASSVNGIKKKISEAEEAEQSEEDAKE